MRLVGIRIGARAKERHAVYIEHLVVLRPSNTEMLLDLPKNITGGICRFLDNVSMLRLRKVSKSTKDSADVFLLSTQKTVAKSFSIRQLHPLNKTLMAIEFNRHWDYYVWRGGFLYMTKLLREEHDLDEATEFVVIDFTKKLYAFVRSDELGLFVEYLKPFLKRTEFRRLDIPSCSRKTFQTFSKFLVNKTHHICIDNRFRRKCRKRKLASFLDLIKRAQPDNEVVEFSGEMHTKRCLEWLLNLSDMVQSLTINVEIERESEFDLVPIIQDFLFRKCENINIDFMSSQFLTLADVEHLIQIFHRTDKKVTISASTDAESMNAQIGVYSINAYDIFRSRRISIKHL